MDNQQIKPKPGPTYKPSNGSKYGSLIPKVQSPIVQPIKYIQHFPVFQKRRYKAVKFFDLRVCPTAKFQKVKNVLKPVKYIAKAKLELNPERNFEYLYTTLSHKVHALDVDKLVNLPAKQKDLIVRRLREFRYLTGLKVSDVKPENDKYKLKEINNFQYSIQSLRNLESISFMGDRNLTFLGSGMCKILPYLHKVKKIEGPINGCVLRDLSKFSQSANKFANLQEFKFEIAENTLNEETLYGLRDWMMELQHARKLILVITDAKFELDLSVLNKVEVLEVVYEMSECLPTLAENVKNLQNMLIPVSVDWKVNSSDTHNHPMTQEFIRNLSNLRNVKKMSQLYSFQDEESVLTGCYPVWEDILSYYNFQMIETLNLGIFLNDRKVEEFQEKFVSGLRNMHRLRVLGLTLHNDGSSNKRFHLTNSILELPKVIATLPCLNEFEFNTEIEITLNILSEFFRGLTQLKNIRRFKSEWLQTSQNSLKAFAKRLHQMKNLEQLDIHLYSLYDIPRKELDPIFESMGESLLKMPNLKALQITADNECFAQGEVWQQWQDRMRSENRKKFIELSLAETE